MAITQLAVYATEAIEEMQMIDQVYGLSYMEVHSCQCISPPHCFPSAVLRTSITLLSLLSVN